jgi:hypothetical protein
MHNGGIADFPKIKRKLQGQLTDEVFNVVQGNTGIYTLTPLIPIMHSHYR